MNEFKEKREKLESFRRLRIKKTKVHPVGDYIRLVSDKDTFTGLDVEMRSEDPLLFPGYREKLEKEKIRARADDAFSYGMCGIDGIPAVVGELSKYFFMGSMGSVVGEKIVNACELSEREKLPLIIFSASGGARMQEGMYSLIQMARTAAAVTRYKDKGGLFISVLTDPVTGGVSASFASLGDITLAEPGALIGFAGPRVIEQTIGEKLPEGFQRAEFQKDHGFVDRIVPKENMKAELSLLLRLHGYGRKNNKIIAIPKAKVIRECSGKEERFISTKSAYERVLAARDAARPKITDFINALFTDFTELSGDRLHGEDKAILAGIAYFDGKPVTVIGHRKGSDIAESISVNFGMADPAGYRKAARLMREAERFHRPVITFIDTPGAYPGKEAEENGISSAIAENLALMSKLKVPVITIVTGEGNSGGALGIGVCDRMIMLENAVYSVLSPEGFASILWKEQGKVKEACDVMKLTALDMKLAGFADIIVNEPREGLLCGKDEKEISVKIREMLHDAIAGCLDELCALTGDELAEKRYERYMKMGKLPGCEETEAESRANT